MREGEEDRELMSEGGRPSVYSQCCDMFVMFSHRGDFQTACFHFTVWHVPSTDVAEFHTADMRPDRICQIRWREARRDEMIYEMREMRRGESRWV